MKSNFDVFLFNFLFEKTAVLNRLLLDIQDKLFLNAFRVKQSHHALRDLVTFKVVVFTLRI